MLLAPLYANTALFAKQAASLDRLSGGRLVLGLGLGGRDDDFTASALPTEGKGRRLEQQLTEMKRIWSGEQLRLRRRDRARAGAAPAAPSSSSAARPRRASAGWRCSATAGSWAAARRTCSPRPRPGSTRPGRRRAGPARPRKLSLAYFALGPDARNQADNYLLHYYNWLGDVARQIAAGAAVSTEMVKGYAAAFEAAGCDELIFVPTTAAPDQISLLASAVL